MTHPTVTLAGNSYDVPPLVPRQNRNILEAIIRTVPPMMKFVNDVREGRVFETQFPKASYNDLLVISYWGAIWPNGKREPVDATLDQITALFDSIPAMFEELIAAALTIQMQTGIFKKADAEAAPSGEAPTPPAPQASGQSPT